MWQGHGCIVDVQHSSTSRKRGCGRMPDAHLARGRTRQRWCRGRRNVPRCRQPARPKQQAPPSRTARTRMRLAPVSGTAGKALQSEAWTISLMERASPGRIRRPHDLRCEAHNDEPTTSARCGALVMSLFSGANTSHQRMLLGARGTKHEAGTQFSHTTS